MSYKESQSEEYSQDMPLERVFNSATSRVLDFLILNQGFDYSEADLARIAKIPSRTLQRAIPLLVQERLVRKTRSGKMFVYKLDDESERAKKLRDYVLATLKENVHSMASKQSVVVPKNQHTILTL